MRFEILKKAVMDHPVVPWVCGRSLDGIAGSNPGRGMDVCLL